MTCKSFLSVQKKTFTNDSKKRRRNAFFQRFPVDKLIIIDFNTIHSNQSQEAKHWSSCRTFLEGPRGDCCWEGIYHCYIPRNTTNYNYTSYMHDSMISIYAKTYAFQEFRAPVIPRKNRIWYWINTGGNQTHSSTIQILDFLKGSLY